MHQSEMFVYGLVHEFVGERGFTMADFTNEHGKFAPEYFSERVFAAARERRDALGDIELDVVIDDPFVGGGDDYSYDYSSFFRIFQARLRSEDTPRDERRDTVHAIIILGVYLVLDEQDDDDRAYAQD